ncbi:hypothetical protein HYALB_00009982 [Hymenoscyphus albidus]|uniref:Uncharacterized protein n=1 Tax=Hymenoscyphus albidus TaxID=595503 RepID=A0A9N9LVQ3_9HELO|nr:hypothetical protein HYALB_00009982 [Hymenoscyphus albidus]
MSSKTPDVQTAAVAGAGAGGKEGVVVRFILAPLAFLSFILSLALVDSRNTYFRTSSPSSSHPPSRIQSVKGFFHALVFRRREGPYEYVGRERGRGDGGVEKKGKGKEKGKGEWYWHTKQRKMMKRELDDAFEMRNGVAVALVFGGLSVLLGVGGSVGHARYLEMCRLPFANEY